MFEKNQNKGVSRRNVLKFGAGVIGTSAETAGLGTEMVAPRRAITNEALAPDQAIDLLMEGNRRFIKRRQSHPHQDVSG